MAAFKLKKKKAPVDGAEFEQYMIEIGEWIRTDTGIAINPKKGYTPADQIKSGFTAWKKRRDQK